MASTMRIWAGDDGESHLEDIDLGFAESAFLPAGPPMLLTEQMPATTCFVARVPSGWDAGWHAAPVRELALYLAGHGEIEASDGEVRAIEPGTILLVEDTTGRGHLTRVTGDDEVLVVIVTLPDADGSADA